MSFTKKFVDGVNSLLEQVAADDEPLSGVNEAELDAELAARKRLRASGKVRPPAENPVAELAGPGEDARRRREKAQQQRMERVRKASRAREEAERAAQEDAFRRMKEEARRGGGAGRAYGSGSASGSSGSSSTGRRRGGGGFGGLGQDAEIAKHYRVLNLKYGAPADEVKSAYRKLMRKYHPDLHNDSPKKQKAATELSMQVTQAYNAIEAWLNDK